MDGGTSVWTEIVNNTEEYVFQDVPDLITGDFDSADMTHVEHFKLLGAKVVPTPDQDFTDFTKCLQQVSEEMKNNNKLAEIEAVFSFVESSGRLDQIMANIQTLFLAQDLIRLPVYMLSSTGLSWLLPPGKHQINVRSDQSDASIQSHDTDLTNQGVGVVSERSHCGLIPLDGRSVVSTSGLKWNLDKGVLRFGELVSTSNGFDLTQEHVLIETDKPLLWTMDFE